MSLKELTMQEHRNAERQAFAAVLMSGEINPRTYYFYLLNQHACYSALESHKLFNLFEDEKSSHIGKSILSREWFDKFTLDNLNDSRF